MTKMSTEFWYYLFIKRITFTVTQATKGSSMRSFEMISNFKTYIVNTRYPEFSRCGETFRENLSLTQVRHTSEGP